MTRVDQTVSSPRSQSGDGASSVVLAYWQELGPAEVNLMKIVEFFGGVIRLIRINERMLGKADFSKLIPASRRLIISSAVLQNLGTLGKVTNLRAAIAQLSDNILVYGFAAEAGSERVVADLSGGTLQRVANLDASEKTVAIASDLRAICRQMSGLNFKGRAGDCAKAFMVRAGARVAACISINGYPLLVHAREGGCHMMLSAGEIADLDAAVPRRTVPLHFFCRLAPVLMFLQHGSQGEFWHTDSPSACLVIDDPLLRKQYGFLDYDRLSDLMESEQFSTSIAFIPWNFKRSDGRFAKQFAARSGRFSLSVHGCDHSRGEFGGSDSLALQQAAQLALDRMNIHRRLSGVAFDDVMVFPQCIFSTHAMQALKAAGYLAVANSSEFPVDANDSLQLRDLLEVAVTRFSNVPLFIRRSAWNVPELAFDLFLGKPALLVEHHQFFREGYRCLAQAVRQLRNADQQLRWRSLGSICSEARSQRIVKGTTEVRFFSDRFTLTNESHKVRNYVLTRRVLPEDTLKDVWINGANAEWSRQEDCVTVHARLAPGERASLRIETVLPERSSPGRRPLLHRAKVFVRRNLSEFRDNYVEKSPWRGALVRSPRRGT